MSQLQRKILFPTPVYFRDIPNAKELNKYKKSNEDISRKMDDVNPCYIPRNHIIERGLGIASEGDISQIKEINELLRSPHLEKNISKDYLSPSSDSDLPYITYCGT